MADKEDKEEVMETEEGIVLIEDVGAEEGGVVAEVVDGEAEDVVGEDVVGIVQITGRINRRGETAKAVRTGRINRRGETAKAVRTGKIDMIVRTVKTVRAHLLGAAEAAVDPDRLPLPDLSNAADLDLPLLLEIHLVPEKTEKLPTTRTVLLTVKNMLTVKNS